MSALKDDPGFEPVVTLLEGALATAAKLISNRRLMCRLAVLPGATFGVAKQFVEGHPDLNSVQYKEFLSLIKAAGSSDAPGGAGKGSKRP